MANSINSGDIIKETFKSLRELIPILARTLLIPATLLTLMNYAYLFQQSTWQHVLLIALGLLLNTWVAVTVHRLLLIGTNSVPTWGLKQFSWREAVFFVYSSLFYLLIISLLYLNYFFGYFGIASLGITAFLVVCIVLMFIRLSLVFPAIATNKSMTFTQSWRVTLPYQRPLLITLVVFPLVLAAPSYAFNFLPEPPKIIFTSILDTLLEIIFIATLSVSYRRIRENEYSS